MSTHQLFMHRALELAAKGLGQVSSNPMVGAVLVHNGKIIGEGYHQRYGEAHAEVNAINSVCPSAEHLIPQSTLYVSLEPCNHQAKTPACTNLILEKGIKHVVIASTDPNPKVSGKGIARLQEAGVNVETGVLEEEAKQLNRRFFTFHQRKRPYVILKWAQSADGYFTPDRNSQTWLSNAYSTKLVHKWRAEEDAILVGTKTAIVDNPGLTVRYWKGENPLRITIDKAVIIPDNHQLLDRSTPTIIYNKLGGHMAKNLEHYRLDWRENIVPSILSDLYERNIQSLIVEGGAETLKSFIDEDLWDEARIFHAAKALGGGTAAPLFRGVLVNTQTLEGDHLLTYTNPEPA